MQTITPLNTTVIISEHDNLIFSLKYVLCWFYNALRQPAGLCAARPISTPLLDKMVEKVRSPKAGTP